jgi:hypothetical protein
VGLWRLACENRCGESCFLKFPDSPRGGNSLWSQTKPQHTQYKKKLKTQSKQLKSGDQVSARISPGIYLLGPGMGRVYCHGAGNATYIDLIHTKYMFLHERVLVIWFENIQMNKIKLVHSFSSEWRPHGTQISWSPRGKQTKFAAKVKYQSLWILKSILRPLSNCHPHAKA